MPRKLPLALAGVAAFRAVVKSDRVPFEHSGVKHGNHQQTFTRNRSIMARKDDKPCLDV